MEEKGGEWVESMGVARGSGWNVWVWLAGGGCRWNLWVWLVGVVVDSLIFLIPPLVFPHFGSSIPTFCSRFRKFFWIFNVIFVQFSNK